MDWIARLRQGKTPSSAAQRLADQLQAKDQAVDLLLFRLDDQLEVEKLVLPLASQLAALGVRSSVTSAGPQRVQAVLDGALQKVSMLAAVTTADTGAEERLMDLVEWLIANGRQQLAESLVFIPVGRTLALKPAFTFRHAPLPRLSWPTMVKGGPPVLRRTALGSHQQVVEAILAQALGLE